MRPEWFPVHCICGHVETYDQALDRIDDMHACPHLRPAAKRIDGDLLACGCHQIALHPCDHFRELVTVLPLRRPNRVDTVQDLKQAISELAAGYTGRTCHGCYVFQPSL
jgi:hypothetical protein